MFVVFPWWGVPFFAAGNPVLYNEKSCFPSVGIPILIRHYSCIWNSPQASGAVLMGLGTFIVMNVCYVKLLPLYNLISDSVESVWLDCDVLSLLAILVIFLAQSRQIQGLFCLSAIGHAKHDFSHWDKIYQLLNVWLQYFVCSSNADSAVLHRHNKVLDWKQVLV